MSSKKIQFTQEPPQILDGIEGKNIWIQSLGKFEKVE